MKVYTISDEAWLDFLEGCDGATFFHTPYWYRVWKAYGGYEYGARVFEFRSGRRSLVPIAWTKIAKGLMKRMESSPAGTYGGWVGDQPLNGEESVAILKHLSKEFCQVNIRMNWLLNNKVRQIRGLAEVREDTTQVLGLRGKTIGEILDKWTTNHKRSLKKAEKQGMKIMVAEEDKDWQEYFLVYQDSLRRWGERATNNYSFRLFELLRAVPDKYCKLWLCLYQGKVISGCLVFYFNRHSVYWHGATKSEFFHLRPVHLLKRYIVEDALKSGYWWYDFNPSGGHEGVVRFKKGFGAREINADTIINHRKFVDFFMDKIVWGKKFLRSQGLSKGQ